MYRVQLQKTDVTHTIVFLLAAVYKVQSALHMKLSSTGIFYFILWLTKHYVTYITLVLGYDWLNADLYLLRPADAAAAACICASAAAAHVSMTAADVHVSADVPVSAVAFALQKWDAEQWGETRA